jgi:hypothetical protein
MEKNCDRPITTQEACLRFADVLDVLIPIWRIRIVFVSRKARHVAVVEH